LVGDVITLVDFRDYHEGYALPQTQPDAADEAAAADAGAAAVDGGLLLGAATRRYGALDGSFAAAGRLLAPPAAASGNGLASAAVLRGAPGGQLSLAWSGGRAAWVQEPAAAEHKYRFLKLTVTATTRRDGPAVAHLNEAVRWAVGCRASSSPPF
jgi:hypothetical protein